MVRSSDRLDMNIVVDWDVKPQIKVTNKNMTINKIFDYIEYISILFPDGVIPRDSTVINKVEVVIPQYLYVVMSCIASFCIILTFGFFTFNVIHRNNT